MSVFETAVASSMESRVAALEAAYRTIGALVAGNADQGAEALAQLAGDRATGDAALNRQILAEEKGRRSADQDLYDLLGAEIVARARRDDSARDNANAASVYAGQAMMAALSMGKVYGADYADTLPRGVIAVTIGGAAIAGATPGRYVLAPVGGDIAGVVATLVVTDATHASVEIGNPGLGAGTAAPTFAKPIGATLPAGTTLSASVGSIVDGTETYLALDADGGFFALYRNDGTSTPAQLPGATIPTVAAYQAVLEILRNLNAHGTLGRKEAPVAGSAAAPANIYFATPAPRDGTITWVRIHSQAGGPRDVVLKVGSRSGNTISQIVRRTVAVSGDATITGLSIPILAGQYYGYYTPDSGVDFTVGALADDGGYYFAGGVDLPEVTDADVTTGVRLEISFGIEWLGVTNERIDAIDARGDAADAMFTSLRATQSKIESSFGSQGMRIFGRAQTGSFALDDGRRWCLAVGAGIHFPAGKPLSTMRVHPILHGDGATRIHVSRAYRDIDDAWLQSWPGQGGDVDIDELIFTLDQLGLDPDIGGIADMALGGDLATPAGRVFLFEFRAEDDDGNERRLNFGYADGTGLSQYERGWYAYTALGPNEWQPLAQQFALYAEFYSELFVADGGTGRVDLIGAAYVDVVANGLDVTVTGALHSEGDDIAVQATLTLPAAAAGQERVDLIVADRISGVPSRVVGTARTAHLDAVEWQGAAPAGSILLARALVTESAAYTATAADFRGLVKLGREGEHAALVTRNRALLQGVLPRATRGDGIVLANYSDSLFAQGHGDPLDLPFTANGELRDRIDWYFGTYPGDTWAKIQAFSRWGAATAGHSRITPPWAIKWMLDRIAGREVVTYLNFGIGSTNSGSTPRNALDPNRLLPMLVSGAHLVTDNFGMNEPGSTATYGNLVALAGLQRERGMLPILYGCLRPHPNAMDREAWIYTNKAIEAAARDSGSLFISTAMIADDRNLGGLGIPVQCCGSANYLNHPGFYQLVREGENALAQLGGA